MGNTVASKSSNLSTKQNVNEFETCYSKEEFYKEKLPQVVIDVRKKDYFKLNTLNLAGNYQGTRYDESRNYYKNRLIATENFLMYLNIQYKLPYFM